MLVARRENEDERRLYPSLDPLPLTLYSLPSEGFSLPHLFAWLRILLLSFSLSHHLACAPIVIYSGDYSSIESVS